jgi:hypothetical protein
MLDFPLIYCNGDSYSDENYHPSCQGNVYANAVAEQCRGFVLNKAVSGSCNRRIIRTTIHDAINQRKVNPTQHIIALIGLSFEMRSELWVDNILGKPPEESNFKTHTFAKKQSWREDLLAGKDIEATNLFNLDRKFFEHYSKGRAYFYNPYAERINLLTDLVMLRSTLESLDVDFLIFQAPRAEKLEDDYLLNFLKQQICDDQRFFDFETFGFCDWAHSKNFTPLDNLNQFKIGHYGPDAHRAFAHEILIPRLQQLKIL